MEPMLCCSYAAADGSWIAWKSGAEAALCTPRCLGPAAAAPAGSTPGWLCLPEAQKVRFLPRVNPEQPELADLCLQIHAGGESVIWEDAWLRPQKGLTWEGVEAFTEAPADGWTFSVRAAAGGGKAPVSVFCAPGRLCLPACGRKAGRGPDKTDSVHGGRSDAELCDKRRGQRARRDPFAEWEAGLCAKHGRLRRPLWQRLQDPGIISWAADAGRPDRPDDPFEI